MSLGQLQRTTTPVREQRSYPYFQSLSIAGVVFGVIVRLVQYLSNRSLWEDEANLALNLVNRSYAELLKPLDYNQAAPPGFLWIEKTAIQVFGNTEYALRLFPLIAGMISLIAFYKLANRYAAGIAVPIAIALLACLRYPLYYASEVKQYSSDVMVALLLALWLMPLRDQRLDRGQLFRLGLLGAGLIWLSHPAVFVLAGIEICHFLLAANKQRWAMWVNRVPMYFTWLISFAGLYFLTIRGTLGNETLTDSWNTRYPNSLVDVLWLLDAFGRFFYNPLGFLGITDGIAILAFVVGSVAYYRRNRTRFLVLMSPLIMTIVASYLEKYPFRERLVLFLTPFAILVIAEGIAWLLTRRRDRYKVALIAGALLFSVLVLPPVARASALLVQPTQVEEIRPVIAYVKAHQAPGDKLYIYRSGVNQFLYYAPRFGYTSDDYILGEHSMATGGRRNRQLLPAGVRQFKREVKQLRGEPRVWFLFCRASEMEEEAFVSTMKPIGQQLDTFRQTDAFVNLYRVKSQAK